MRAVIQRVAEAKVSIDGVVQGAIAKGLAVLLAVEEADTAEDIEWLSGKIVRLRVFNDEDGVMNRSVQEAQGAILLVSQFTLFASTKKGNRPSYSRSAGPDIAVPLYEQFVAPAGAGFGQADSDRRVRGAHAGEPHQRRAGHHHHRFTDTGVT